MKTTKVKPFLSFKLYIVLTIFILSVLLRLWNLNAMGRTWDERIYIEWAYNFMNLIKKGDFSNPYWYKISGSPPISRYLYGPGTLLDFQKIDEHNQPIFHYDFTYTRLISVLFSSLSVGLVILLGWKYISPFVGIVAGIILSMLPLFVGYSQLATLESLIVFFFTGTLYAFFNFIEHVSKKNILLTGILLGLALGVKYTNILLIPLIVWIYFIWFFYHKKTIRESMNHIKGAMALFIIAGITIFAIWPMPWFHLDYVIAYNSKLRYSPYSVPEVFFGKLLLVPKVYYLVYFLITTPLGIISLFLLGLLSISQKNISYFFPSTLIQQIFKSRHIKLIAIRFSTKKLINICKSFLLLDPKNNIKHNSSKYRNWVLYSIVAWFCFPFIQSLYNFRQHGIRYIIEIYAPLSIIAAIGLDYILSRQLKKLRFIQRIKHINIISVIILVSYLFFILIQSTPYYLEYFNGLVGGTRNVYEKKLFQLGWWGQGIKEAALYIEKNAPLGSKIGIALSPAEVMPTLPQFTVEEYNDRKIYDYVIVNYYNIIREGFNDSLIKQNYNVVYTVDANGAKLVKVYKLKK